MGVRHALFAIVALLVFAPAARADTFSLQHYHSGTLDAEAQGDVTFPDAGGAVVNVTVSDRAQDGWCGDAWVRTNLPPATHKLYQVCDVGKQQTWTYTVPPSARCDITFVEVQVGRIDPSNGNKTELGEAKRIDHPCPPLPQPAPPPPPQKIDSGVSFNWMANHRWTQNTRLSVRDVPAGASVELLCRGHGCPGKRKTVKVSKAAKADAHRLLGRRHLRPGAVLELRVTRADMIGKVVRFRVRRGHTPAWQVLCLPPGANAPARC
jgi:hypothetical protein